VLQLSNVFFSLHYRSNPALMLQLNSSKQQQQQQQQHQEDNTNEP
jgi:hypothetical protein